MFSDKGLSRMKDLVEQSQQNSIGEYILEYDDGKQRQYDDGVNYRQCGIYNFVCKEGQREFMPHICRADKYFSEVFG